jgi:hypothetical protein
VAPRARCGAVRVRGEGGLEPLPSGLLLRGQPRRFGRGGIGLPPDAALHPWREEHREWWEKQDEYLRSESQYWRELTAVE